MEPKIELHNQRIVMKDEDTEVQIITDDVEDMTPYIKKLFEWATTVWDYNAVEYWNTDEYSLLAAQEGYFKVHKLGNDDKHGLFLGKYADSPTSLEDYDSREIHAYVYMKVTKEEFDKLSNKSTESY